jgi:PAS domain S-box-containing protein
LNNKCEQKLSEFKIIIVEDDNGLRRLMQKELERFGYNVKLASNGEKAMQLIEGAKTEFLLIDYKLPDMSGKELVLKLREKLGYTPNFVTLTGYGNEKIAVDMMKLGSRDYIVKEQNFMELLLEVLKRNCADISNEIKLEETEARLRKNIELLRETGELAKVGGWEIDLKTNIVFWTDTTKKIHEVPEDYTPDLSTALDFFTNGARQKIEKAVDDAIKKGKSYSLELPFISAKGNNLWVIAQGKPEMKNGECIRLHGTFQDITKRKQAELELKKKTAVLKRTEQVAHVGSWDWDIESDTVTWSDELFRIFKRNPKLGAVSYAEHPKVYTPESMKKLDEAVQRCVKTGKSYEIDLEIIRGDGKTAFCSALGFAKKNEKGKVIQLYGSFQDITQRKKEEEHLKQLNKELAASEKVNKKLAFNLGERVKELKCLYSIASVIEKPGIKLDEIFQETVNLIPFGWLYPNDTYARIIYKNKEYRSTHFHKSEIKISRQLPGKENRGIIELFLNDKKQDNGKLKFIKEERELLYLISERLSRVIDRFEAEEQLQQIRELLEETERAGKIGGWEIDAETKKQTWTEEVFRILQIDMNIHEPEVPEGVEFIHPEYRKRAERAVSEALEKGKSFNEEWLVITARGKECWVNAVCKPKFKKGKVVKITGSLQDITKRKEVEEKLRAINRQLKDSEQQLMASNQQLYALNQQLVSGEQQLKAANQQLAANEQQLRAANQQLVANEEELKRNNEILKKYLNVAAEIVISLDENGKITLLNESGHRICGYNPGELIGKDWFAICVPEEERKDIKDYFLKLKKGEIKGSEHFESEIITKLGERKIILWHNTIFRDDDGNFTGTLSSGEDITERKRAEQKLIESEERFRKAQEAGHIGSWEYNLQSEEFWGSDEGKRIYNLDLEQKEFPADEVMNLVAEKDREKVNQAMIDLLNENKPYDIIFEITPKNTKQKKIIRSIAELQRDESGNPLKVTGVLHDITLQKTIEKQLIEAKEKAEEADKLKSAFLANMSHEIRTPMNGILGFTELLQNPELTGEQQQKFIEIIHESGNRMLETVNAIIDISRIETGQIEMKIAETNVNNEIETLYNFFLPEAKKKGLQLSLEKLLSEENSHWFTDVSKFNSIFTNLVKNAIKYTDEGTIDIGCEVKNGQLYCYVKDTGIGIPEDRQNAVFNRFEQADIADTRAFEGSGLGLAIAKAYVEMIGGKIGVKSEEGRGSEFWFMVPEQPGKQEKEIDNGKSDIVGKSAPKKLKIIIAEDDEISAEFLSVLLKNTASEIFWAKSGKETVELCKKHPDADLVLMDIKMPDGNGYDALKEIRKFDNNVRIIAQTANALAGDREKILDSGFDEYVSKPVLKKDLMMKIDALFS